MKDAQLFAKQLAELCQPYPWNPTNSQLAEIARHFVLTPPTSASEACAIISSVYKDALYMNMEGVDNSDLRTLLALAIAAAKA